MPSYRQTLTKRFLTRTSNPANTTAPSSSAQASEPPQINVGDNASGAVSPRPPLPDAALRAVFLVYWKARHPGHRSPKSLPWTLSHVCHSWRNVAISMPNLWSSIPRIDFKKDKSPPKPGLIERRTAMTAELIRRSEGSLGLDLIVHIDNKFTGLRSHPLFLLICQHSEKWRIFDIWATAATLAEFGTIRCQLTSLTNLDIYLWSWTKEPPVQMLDMFEVAPLLKHIHINGRYDGQMKLPPVENITDYTGVVSRALQASWTYDNLTHLDITESVRGISDELVILKFPRLSHLEVSSPATLEHSLLTRSVFPVLSLLSVSYHLSTVDKICGVVAAAISRSNCCSIKDLTLRGSRSIGPNPIPDLMTLLSLTPCLEKLNTQIPEDTIITKLGTWGPGQQILLPALQLISISIPCPLQKSTIAALQHLACVRSEFWPLRANTGAWDTPVPCHLDIHLNISRDEDSRNIVVSPIELETWYIGPTASAARLCELAAALRAATPAWYTSHKKKLSKGTLKKLENALKAIEATNVTNVNDLLPSSIHLALGHLARIYQKKDPDNRYPHFANRAKEMLAKWAPLFKMSLQEFSWAWLSVTSYDSMSLMYVPEDCVYRSKKNRFLHDVLGLGTGYSEVHIDMPAEDGVSIEG